MSDKVGGLTWYYRAEVRDGMLRVQRTNLLLPEMLEVPFQSVTNAAVHTVNVRRVELIVFGDGAEIGRLRSGIAGRRHAQKVATWINQRVQEQSQGARPTA